MAGNGNAMNLITMSELRSNFSWQFMSEFYRYYEDSISNEMKDEIVELCVNQFFELSPSCCFLGVADPNLWRMVLDRLLTVGESVEVLGKWSTLVLPIFDRFYPDIEAVDENVFQTLTGVRYLPVINDIGDVWILLAMECTVVGVEKNKLSSLQLRAVDCLSKFWCQCDYEKLMEIIVGLEQEEEINGVGLISNMNVESIIIADDEEANSVFAGISGNNDDNMLVGIKMILERQSKKFLRLLYFKILSYEGSD